MKRIRRSRVFQIVSFVMLLLLVFTACSSQGVLDEKDPGEDDEKEPIVLAGLQMDSADFHNSVVKLVLEEAFGYEVEVLDGSSAALLTGFENGDIDIEMEAWVQNMAEKYFELVESGEIVEVSTNYNDNAQGFYVPTFVIEGDAERGIEPMAPGLRTVEDLKKYPEVFQDEEDPSKGRIYGVPSIWAQTDEQFRTKVETYGLDEMYSYFNPGSDAGLAASLGGAYESGDPWVGYYWEPTWLTGKYDLTLLEEASYSDELWEQGHACFWPPVDVKVIVYEDLPERAPEVVEFLSNYETSSEITSQALAYMQDHDATTDETAVWFFQNYEEVWTQWLSEGEVEIIKEAI